MDVNVTNRELLTDEEIVAEVSLKHSASEEEEEAMIVTPSISETYNNSNGIGNYLQLHCAPEKHINIVNTCVVSRKCIFPL